VIFFHGHYRDLTVLPDQDHPVTDVRPPCGVMGRRGGAYWGRGEVGVMDPNPDALRCHDPINIGKMQIALENYEPFRARLEQEDLDNTA